MRRAGIFFAQKHIEAARRLSEELGGTDSDVKAYFFGLEDETLSAVLDKYERKYGKGKRRYAEQILPEWKSGRRKMSGVVAERLFGLLPPMMPLDTKYDMVRTLWQTYSPRSHGSFVIGPDCDPTVVSAEIEQQLLREVIEYPIPDPLAKRFQWLSSGDVEVSQKLLNHFLGEERALIVSDARTRSQIVLSHFKTGGRWTDRIRQEYRIGNHRLELFFDPRATGIRKGHPDTLFKPNRANPKDSVGAKSKSTAAAEAKKTANIANDGSVGEWTLLWLIASVVVIGLTCCLSSLPTAANLHNNGLSGATEPTPVLSKPDVGFETPNTIEQPEGASQILAERDFSLPGHSRMALKVVLGVRQADSVYVRSALLEVAKREKYDTVMVYGYLRGKDIDRDPPAGILEYGKHGRGWEPESVLPKEGVFERSELRHSGGKKEPVPVMHVNGEIPPWSTVQDSAAAANLIEERLHVFEPKRPSMTELDQARLALKSLAASLGASEAEVMTLSKADRRNAMINHISIKYRVSKSELWRVWLDHFAPDQRVKPTGKRNVVPAPRVAH